MFINKNSLIEYLINDYLSEITTLNYIICSQIILDLNTTRTEVNKLFFKNIKNKLSDFNNKERQESLNNYFNNLFYHYEYK